MNKLPRWSWKVLAPLCFGVLVVALIGSHWLLNSSAHVEKEERAKPALQPAPAIQLLLAGTGSCSARGCHGAIEPVLVPGDPERCRQNEYTLWAHDRHAGAYQTLLNERSEKMIKLLGENKKASEDSRCLVCHTNPLLAALPQDDLFVQEEKRFGVSCESCHGSANQWLIPHTAPGWRKQKPAGQMRDLADPMVQAKICAGCHVGAAADKALLREVNHDFIAAGHPRLHFEFGSYRANLPAHWPPKFRSEAQLWAVGQVASAQATLDLLHQRANDKQMFRPEFAEYDCFACHHSLADSAWRRPARRHQRKAGSLPWGSWYFALARELDDEFATILRPLQENMQKSLPDGLGVAGQTGAALKKLQELQAQWAGPGNDRGAAVARARILDRLKTGALTLTPCWDEAEQLYLAMYALSPSPALAELAKERGFAPGLDGPLSWPRRQRQPFDPLQFLEKLQGFAQTR